MAALPWHRAFAATGWRTFETVTRVEVINPAGRTLAWVPLPLADHTGWFRDVLEPTGKVLDVGAGSYNFV